MNVATEKITAATDAKNVLREARSYMTGALLYIATWHKTWHANPNHCSAGRS
jgi:hypothetical protein